MSLPHQAAVRVELNRHFGSIMTSDNRSRFLFQVLDAGRVQAYDEPYTLLQDPGGIFFKMVQQTGKQEAAALLEAAKQVRWTLGTQII